MLVLVAVFGLFFELMYILYCSNSLGVWVVDNLKRVMVSLPASLLAEVDGFIQQAQGNRSQFIREAMRVYLTDLRRRELRQKMQEGYKEMASINLHLAHEGLAEEPQLLEKYEEGLVECDGDSCEKR